MNGQSRPRPIRSCSARDTGLVRMLSWVNQEGDGLPMSCQGLALECGYGSGP